jgi:hypothetical protein
VELDVEASDCLGDLGLVDHVVEGREVDGEAGPAGGDRESDRDVGLADPGRSQQGRVGLCLNEGEGGQVFDLAGSSSG